MAAPASTAQVLSSASKSGQTWSLLLDSNGSHPVLYVFNSQSTNTNGYLGYFDNDGSWNVGGTKYGPNGVSTSSVNITSSGLTVNGPSVFNANGTSVTPITINGIAGQAVDLLEVYGTSGGTKYVWVDSTGQLHGSAGITANAMTIAGNTSTNSLAFAGGNLHNDGSNLYLDAVSGIWLRPNAGTSSQGINITATGTTVNNALTATGLLTATGAKINVTGGGGAAQTLQLYDTTNGASSPSKYLRVNAGSFQICNNAFSNVPWSMSDAGDVSQTGSLSIQSANLYMNNAPTPGTPTLSQTAGGTAASGTFFAKVTWNTSFGETSASAEASFTVSANNQLVVTPPAAPGNAPSITSWNVYVSSTTGTETKQASNLTLGAAWTMPTTGLVAGAALPIADSSSGALRFGNGTFLNPTTFNKLAGGTGTWVFTFANAGSLNSANPFWNGYHFATADVLTHAGSNTFPRASVFNSYSQVADPTDLYFNIQTGNAASIPYGIKFTPATGGSIYLNGSTVAAGSITASTGANLAIGGQGTGSAVNVNYNTGATAGLYIYDGGSTNQIALAPGATPAIAFNGANTLYQNSSYLYLYTPSNGGIILHANGTTPQDIAIFSNSGNLSIVGAFSTGSTIVASGIIKSQTQLIMNDNKTQILLCSDGGSSSYIESGNSAWTASADLHLTGYNGNVLNNLYLNATSLQVTGATTTTALNIAGNANGMPALGLDNTTIASPGLNFMLPKAAPTYGYRFFTNGTSTQLLQLNESAATFSVPMTATSFAASNGLFTTSGGGTGLLRLASSGTGGVQITNSTQGTQNALFPDAGGLTLNGALSTGSSTYGPTSATINGTTNVYGYVNLMASGTATSGTTSYSSQVLQLQTSYWNGSAAATAVGLLQLGGGTSYQQLFIAAPGGVVFQAPQGTNTAIIDQNKNLTVYGGVYSSSFNAQSGAAYLNAASGGNAVYINSGNSATGGLIVRDGGSTNQISLVPGAASGIAFNGVNALYQNSSYLYVYTPSNGGIILHANGTTSQDIATFANNGNLSIVGALSAASASFTTPLPVSSGGTGTSSPGLIAGTGITITGSWPNQTISATSSSGGASLSTANTWTASQTFGAATTFNAPTTWSTGVRPLSINQGTTSPVAAQIWFGDTNSIIAGGWKLGFYDGDGSHQMFLLSASAGLEFNPAGVAASGGNFASNGALQFNNSTWNGSAAITNTWKHSMDASNNLLWQFNGATQVTLGSGGAATFNGALSSATLSTGNATINGIATVGGSGGTDFLWTNTSYGTSTHFYQSSGVTVAGVGGGGFGIWQSTNGNLFSVDGSGSVGVKSQIFAGSDITAAGALISTYNAGGSGLRGIGTNGPALQWNKSNGNGEVNFLNGWNNGAAGLDSSHPAFDWWTNESGTAQQIMQVTRSGDLFLGNANRNGWVRTFGSTGWYSQTYGGGIYMTDTTYVRVYNGKHFYTSADVGAGGALRAGQAGWGGSSVNGDWMFWPNTAGVTQFGTHTDASTAGVNGGLFAIARQSIAWYVCVDQSGNMGIAGSYYAGSLSTLKRDIAPVTHRALDILRSTEIVHFRYKTDPKDHALRTGFIAEHTHPLLSGPKQEQFDFMAVDAMTIKAVQELEDLLEQERCARKTLESRIAALETYLNLRQEA